MPFAPPDPIALFLLTSLVLAVWARRAD